MHLKIVDIFIHYRGVRNEKKNNNNTTNEI